MITFQRESIRDCWDELEPLFQQHHDELGEAKDKLPFRMNRKAYANMEAIGLLHLITVRDRDPIIGYYACFISPALTHDVLAAHTHFFYLQPDYRKGMTGYTLFTEAAQMLAALGVKAWYVGERDIYPITPILERLGFEPIERLYRRIM